MSRERIEFVDADQRVFVRGVTMKIFVLHEAGELPELREVTAEEIDLVHHAEDARHLAFAAEDACENLPWRLGITKLARDQTETAAEQIGQLGAEIELVLLRVLERLHHLLRIAG